MEEVAAWGSRAIVGVAIYYKSAKVETSGGSTPHLRSPFSSLGVKVVGVCFRGGTEELSFLVDLTGGDSLLFGRVVVCYSGTKVEDRWRGSLSPCCPHRTFRGYCGVCRRRTSTSGDVSMLSVCCRSSVSDWLWCSSYDHHLFVNVWQFCDRLGHIVVVVALLCQESFLLSLWLQFELFVACVFLPGCWCLLRWRNRVCYL